MTCDPCVLGGSLTASNVLSRPENGQLADAGTDDRRDRRPRLRPQRVTDVARGVEDTVSAAGLAGILCNSDDMTAKEDFAAAAAVPLTSVRKPRQELGRRAAELLLDEARHDDHLHEQLVFEPTLVVRESSMVRHLSTERKGTA